jgi:hypothetical protein
MANWLSRLERDIDSIYEIVKYDGPFGCGHMLNDDALHKIRQILEKLIEDAEETKEEEIWKGGKK